MEFSLGLSVKPGIAHRLGEFPKQTQVSPSPQPTALSLGRSCQTQRGQGARAPGTCKPSDGCWGWNSGPRQEQAICAHSQSHHASLWLTIKLSSSKKKKTSKVSMATIGGGDGCLAMSTLPACSGGIISSPCCPLPSPHGGLPATASHPYPAQQRSHPPTGRLLSAFCLSEPS